MLCDDAEVDSAYSEQCLTQGIINGVTGQKEERDNTHCF